MIGQLILSLSILIVLHEMGHFFPARWFNTRVEKFYLFFDPWFELFKFKKGDTEYGIGWLPLGGYVKIAGMIDESMDTEQMKQPPQPWEFRSKPAWQRLIIMMGGVTVNFILGMIIFAGILFKWGDQYLPVENAKFGIAVDSLGVELGLQDGDIIKSVGDLEFKKFNDRLVVQEIIINDADNIKLVRDGRDKTLNVDPRFIGELGARKNKDNRLFTARMPFEVSGVSEDEKYPAKKAGIQKGDKIISYNGTPTPFYHEYKKMAIKNGNKPCTLGIIRGADTLAINITPRPNGIIGVGAKPLDLATQEYTFMESIPAGIKRGWNFLGTQVKAFGQIFKGKMKFSESIGGFGTIASMFGTEWYWERFWTMTASLSLILAFMNLLPIPALDGGHVMFLLYEVVTGRKPSDKFMEYATIVGFILVMALLIFANGNELYQWIMKKFF